MALKDLELILQDIVEPRSRAFVSEVVKCYQVGAYSAALVSLWTAVVSDLTGKIHHLAESGDGDAKQVAQKLDKALKDRHIPEVQKFEREILATVAEKLEILLPREKEELERLRADRNLCAHPGFLGDNELFAPEAELVRAHLVAATRVVFSQRPIAGKRLLAILKEELADESWPAEDRYFFDRFFDRARPSVKLNMVKLLIKQSITPPEGALLVAARSRQAVHAVAKQAPEAFAESMSSVLESWESSGALQPARLVRVVGAYGAKSVFWSILPSTARSRLEKVVDSSTFDCLLEAGFFVSGRPADQAIGDKFDELVAELEFDQVKRIIEQCDVRRPYVGRVIDAVGSSASFRGAEGNLRLLDRCSRDLVVEDVKRIREAIQQNDHDQIRRAADTEDILISIYESSLPQVQISSEWRTLGKWLHDKGVENGDEYYLYSSFCKVVGLESSELRKDGGVRTGDTVS